MKKHKQANALIHCYLLLCNRSNIIISFSIYIICFIVLIVFMWNLVRNEKKDVLLVNAKFSTKDVMVVHVFKNFECMFAEEIIWTVMNSRFQVSSIKSFKIFFMQKLEYFKYLFYNFIQQSLNEGIEIEKDSLVKSIINALNASDGSTLFKDNHDLSKNELKLEISFEIFQINLNWSNNCKQVQEVSKLYEDFFVYEYMSYSVKFLLNKLKNFGLIFYLFFISDE